MKAMKMFVWEDGEHDGEECHDLFVAFAANVEDARRLVIKKLEELAGGGSFERQFIEQNEPLEVSEPVAFFCTDGKGI